MAPAEFNCGRLRCRVCRVICNTIQLDSRPLLAIQPDQILKMVIVACSGCGPSLHLFPARIERATHNTALKGEGRSHCSDLLDGLYIRAQRGY